jgi:cytochrome c oxidase assembly protein subunit 11
MTTPQPQQSQKNRKTLFILLVIVVLMFGFGFALVPFYNLLCKSIGLNGKTNTVSIANDQTPDLHRWVTVQFLATNNAYLPWDFYPLVHQVKIHPGQNTQIAYYAKNDSDHTMTVQAIPSISPGNVAKYMKKTECFCFRRQTFKAGESRDMPVLFHIDRALPDDVHVITLSYTMFDTAHIGESNNGKVAGKIN